jgi:hypothetical protein
VKCASSFLADGSNAMIAESTFLRTMLDDSMPLGTGSVT